MKSFLRRIFKRGKKGAGLLENFPCLDKRRRHVTLYGPGLAALGVALSQAFIGIGVGGGMMIGVSLMTVIKVGLVVGGALWARSKQPKRGERSSIQGSHQIVNTRSPSQPIAVPYGYNRDGGNWVFAKPSGLKNEKLNIVTAHGWGECEGLGPGIEQPSFIPGAAGSKDDLETRLLNNSFTPEDGHNLVYNGGFANYDAWYADLGWGSGMSAPQGWEISGGKARHVADFTDSLFQMVLLTLSPLPWPVKAGKTYKLTYTVSELGAGDGVTAKLGASSFTTRTANGTYVESIVAPTDGAILSWVPSAASDRFAIDDVSLVEASRTWNYIAVVADSATTFKWSKVGKAGPWEATGVAFTGDWQSVGSSGAQIKASASGHAAGDTWHFYVSSQGVFIDDHLLEFYREYFSIIEWHRSSGDVDPVPWTRNLIGYYAFYNGTAGQGVDSFLHTEKPEWDETMPHICYSVIQLIYDKEAFQGAALEITVNLKGRKLYDTRTSTTAYTRNPALVWRDWMTNSRYSLGVPAAEIPDAFVNEAATWCDNNNYYFDGVIVDRDEFGKHHDDILACFRAFIQWSSGQYKLKIYTDDTPVMTLTDDQLTVQDVFLPGVPETPNKAQGWILDPCRDWTPIPVPVEDKVRIDADGEERLMEMDLPGIKDYELAGKLMTFYLKRNQKNREYTFLCHARARRLEPGDLVYLNNDFLNWSNKKVRVKNVLLPEGDKVPITFWEEDPTIYTTTFSTGTRRFWGRKKGVPRTLATPTGIAATTGSDEFTVNKVDAYVKIEWDNMGAGMSYQLAWWITGNPQFFITVKSPNDISTKVTVRIPALQAAVQFNYSIRAFIPGSTLQQSVWTAVQTLTTWEPNTWEQLKNLVINGDGNIDQPGPTSYRLCLNAWAMGPDMWIGMVYHASTPPSNGQIGRIAPSNAYIPNRPGIYIVNITTGASSANQVYCLHRIEASHAHRLKGKKGSFQFRVYHDLGATQAFYYAVYAADAENDWDPQTLIFEGTVNIPNATDTAVPVPNKSMGDCQHGIAIYIIANGFGAVTLKKVIVTDVQLELGEICTPFELVTPNRILPLVQKHFCKSMLYEEDVYDNAGEPGAEFVEPYQATSYATFPKATFPVVMRTIPEISLWNPLATSGSNKIRNKTDSTNHPGQALYISDFSFIPQVNNSAIAGGRELLVHWSAYAGLFGDLL